MVGTYVATDPDVLICITCAWVSKLTNNSRSCTDL